MARPNNLTMQCRYVAEHGTFANGVALRRHYDENHPEYVPSPSSRRVTCSACLVNVSRGSFDGHRAKMHNNDLRVTYLDDGGASATSTPPSSMVTSGNMRSVSGPITTPHQAPAGTGYCTVCDRPIVRHSVTRHMLTMHNVVVPQGEGANYWRREREAPQLALVTPPAAVAHHHPSMQGAQKMNGTDVIRDVDDIVLPTITVLAMPGDVVAIEHLPALFTWRDQTAAMLRAVRGEA